MAAQLSQQLLFVGLERFTLPLQSANARRVHQGDFYRFAKLRYERSIGRFERGTMGDQQHHTERTFVSVQRGGEAVPTEACWRDKVEDGVTRDRPGSDRRVATPHEELLHGVVRELSTGNDYRGGTRPTGCHGDGVEAAMHEIDLADHEVIGADMRSDNSGDAAYGPLQFEVAARLTPDAQ
jgi:hypothetical protein